MLLECVKYAEPYYMIHIWETATFLHPFLLLLEEKSTFCFIPRTYFMSILFCFRWFDDLSATNANLKAGRIQG